MESSVVAGGRARAWAAIVARRVANGDFAPSTAPEAAAPTDTTSTASTAPPRLLNPVFQLETRPAADAKTAAAAGMTQSDSNAPLMSSDDMSPRAASPLLRAPPHVAQPTAMAAAQMQAPAPAGPGGLKTTRSFRVRLAAAKESRAVAPQSLPLPGEDTFVSMSPLVGARMPAAGGSIGGGSMTPTTLILPPQRSEAATLVLNPAARVVLPLPQHRVADDSSFELAQTVHASTSAPAVSEGDDKAVIIDDGSITPHAVPSLPVASGAAGIGGLLHARAAVHSSPRTTAHADVPAAVVVPPIDRARKGTRNVYEIPLRLANLRLQAATILDPWFPPISGTHTRLQTAGIFVLTGASSGMLGGVIGSGGPPQMVCVCAVQSDGCQPAHLCA